MLKTKDQILNVCLASDDNYVLQAWVLLTSLFENNKSFKKIKIYYLDNGLSKVNKKIIFQVVAKYNHQLEFINVKAKLKKIINFGAQAWTNTSYSTYARIFLGSLLSLDVNKILYLDCDTIVLADLSSLWATDLSHQVIAGVRECGFNVAQKIFAKMEVKNYLKAGVLLINLKKWRQQKIEWKILTYMKNVQARYPYVDQDLINIITKGETLVLPPKYNLTSTYYVWTLPMIHDIYSFKQTNFYHAQELDEAKKQPVIVHFTGMLGQPWFSNCLHPLVDKFDFYLHFSNSPWKNYIKSQEKLFFASKIQRFFIVYTPRFFFAKLTKILAAVNLHYLRKKFSLKKEKLYYED
jgi:lipopolysaccharide biosynthesis glycosyltransferase